MSLLWAKVAADESSEFFHGTVRPLKVGDVISPASSRPDWHQVSFPSETNRDYAYATAKEDDAWHYAEMAHNSQFRPGMKIHPRVYRVRPLGPHEKDPTYDHERGYSRGNFEGDVRSKHGFEVVGEQPMPEHMGEPEDWR